MGNKADKYVSPSGRNADYDRATFVEHVITAASFLVWAEDTGQMFGGETAKDAFAALSRIADLNGVKLRKAAKGA